MQVLESKTVLSRSGAGDGTRTRNPLFGKQIF